ncbi:META domain-containing protein [Lysobacter koreensis]|uniref:META domain-containing protein n=1 Tax=Lysobacter koreensis TaxID=266122 RepID=A0ABW2YMW1_9GAMM
MKACSSGSSRRASPTLALASWHLAVLVALALAACAPAPQADGGKTPPAASPAPTPATGTSPGEPVRVMSSQLADTQWTLLRLRGKPLVEDSHINLEIGRDLLGGYDGCNWYGMKFRDTPTGNPRSFELLGGVESSARGCQSEAHLLQSQQYYAALRAAVTLHREGTRLLATDIDGQPLLAFERLPRFAMDPALLAGSGWRLVTIDGASRAHPAAQAITLRFAESTLRGHAGCRDYTATYLAREDRLSVPSLAMTSTDCANPAALRREGEFTSLLSETARYRFDRKVLTLFTSTGHELGFVPCDEC